VLDDVGNCDTHVARLGLVFPLLSVSAEETTMPKSETSDPNDSAVEDDVISAADEDEDFDDDDDDLGDDEEDEEDEEEEA
jgi:hypothetical protein